MSTPIRLPRSLSFIPDARTGFRLLLLAFACALASAGARAATINVPAGGNLQAALDSAQPGDVLVLEAGATFTGEFTLPPTPASNTSYITVRSSLCTELPAGVRVTMAGAPRMARLATPSVAPVLTAPVNTHHWRFECLEFTQGPTVGTYGYNLIALGDGSAQGTQDTLEEVPHHFEFDRCIIRARDNQTEVQRGISLNSAHTAVKNSHIADIKMEGFDTQALGGWNGPGPFLIENNYLEAAGENIIFGGATPKIPNLVPADIVIRNNHLFKPLSWRVEDPSYAGRPWSVKNLFELKTGRRVRFEGNVLENCWAHAQTGWAVIFNATTDSGAANVIEDVEFVNNIIRNSANGINLRGMDPEIHTGNRMRRVRFANNLLENIGTYDGEGKVFQLLQSSEDVSFDHNTVASLLAKSTALLDTLGSFKHVNCSFTNNVAQHGEYGVLSGGTGAYGAAALDERCGTGSWTFARNLVPGADPTRFPSPSNNYYPPGAQYTAQFVNFAARDYRLAATSCGSIASTCNPKGATNGKDAGVDFDLLNSHVAGVARTNAALASNGATATASSTLDAGRSPVAAINGDRKGVHWGTDPATGSGWHDATQNSFPDWLEVTFDRPKVIEEIDVFGVQNSYLSPSEPTEAMTFSLYGLTAFDVQYWDGTGWETVPGGAVTGNNKVWRKFTFAPVVTNKVRVHVNGAAASYSRVVELEAWTAAVERSNRALGSNGATATASSTLDSGRLPLAAINGDRKGLHWGTNPSTGSGWHDATQNAFPDWLEVSFNATRAVSEVDVFGVQDAVSSPSEPTEAMTFSLYGLTAFDVQYWDGTGWQTVPGGAVTGNNKVWRRFNFPHVMTNKIRVHVSGAAAGYSRVVELEAY